MNTLRSCVRTIILSKGVRTTNYEGCLLHYSIRLFNSALKNRTDEMIYYDYLQLPLNNFVLLHVQGRDASKDG